MKTAHESPVACFEAARFEIQGRARSAVFWLSLSLLVMVPLSFSAKARRIFSLPKFATLIVGASALAALIGLIALSPERRKSLRLLKSKHVFSVSLYLVAIAVSTVFGVAPNRIFNIEWRVKFCCSNGPPDNNFEIRLFENMKDY